MAPEGSERGKPVAKDNITMPRWQWVLICAAVLGAISHTVQLKVNSNRLDNVISTLARQQLQIDAAVDLMASRGPAIDRVNDLKRDIEALKTLVTEVRDDVLTLKAQKAVASIP